VAGKPRKRIDYAGWSVDIFSNDTKIDKLLMAQGWEGFGVYFYLCQMAFGSDGYFYQWCDDLSASTARKMGGYISAGKVKETLDYCLQVGLFDKRLLAEWGVLTSRGIQKSYLQVLKSKNRKGTEIILDYWLLDISNKTDYQDVIFVRKNSHKIGENDHSLGENDHSLGVNDHPLGQKYSKVKYSKVNKKTMCKADACALFESLWKLYPCKKGKGQVSEKSKLKIWQIGFDEMERAILRYKSELDKDTWRKPQNGSTFFNSGYIDYLDGNFVPDKKQSIPDKNQFNQFPQREYDFEKLEKELLGEI
jgi:hypothetical protein